MATYRIAVLPGDGIGSEVIRARRIRVLEAVARATGAAFEFERGLVGRQRASTRTGTAAAPANDRAVRARRTRSCSARWAAPSGTASAASSGRSAGSWPIRKGARPLRQPPRPAKCFPMLVDASPLKRQVVEGTDLMVIRELTGGLYFGEPRGDRALRRRRRARHQHDGVHLARDRRASPAIGFEVARKRRRRLTSVDKANVLGRLAALARGRDPGRRRSIPT